ncbi:MAG TPA: glycosyl hydrolase family 8 [Polyangiaceae bacterium]
MSLVPRRVRHAGGRSGRALPSRAGACLVACLAAAGACRSETNDDGSGEQGLAAAPGAGAGTSSGSGGGSSGSAAVSGGVAGSANLGGSAGVAAGTPGSVAGSAQSAGAAGSAATSGGANSGGSGNMPSGGASSGSGGAIGAGRYPFPQNVFSKHCTYPTNRNSEHARAAYERWKRDIVTADGANGFLRTRRPNSPGAEVNSTVSEGIAYGMILAVVMGDQPVFDGLWKYSQHWKNDNGLMSWYINAAGTQALGTGGATDSDEDIAWALIMADRQWGGSGSLSETYLEAAKRQVDLIWRFEIDHSRDDFLLPGDSWGSNALFNPSYFAPHQYRLFGQVSGNVEGWNNVIDTGYEMLEKCLSPALGNEENGLAPAWCKPDGTLANDQPGNYQYDSARVPFRIGQDYCYNGEPRAAAYLAKVTRFFDAIGAANIVDGYALNGTPQPDADSQPGSPQSAVFVGSVAVGAMHDPQYKKLAEDAYALVAPGDLLARSIYYNMSWTALSLLMLSGNLVDYPP